MLSSGLLIFALSISPGAAPRCSADEGPEPAAYELWYGIYMSGERVGSLSQQLSLPKDNDEGVFIHTTRKQMNLRVDGRKIKVDSRTRMLFDRFRPYQLRSAEEIFTRDGEERRVTLSRRGDEFDVAVEVDKKKRSLQPVELQYSLENLLASRRWIAEHPAVGQTLRTIELDMENFAVSSVEQVVLRSLEGKSFDVRVRSNARGELGVARVNAEGVVESFDFGGALSLKFEPAETAQQASFSDDLRQKTQSPVDRALGDPNRIQRLALELQGDAIDVVSRILDTNIELDKTTGAHVLIRVEATPKYTGTDPDEMQRSLAETVHYPIRDELIRMVASRVVEGSQSQAEAAKRLVAFVNKAVRSSDTGKSLDITDVLRTRNGTCRDRARLLTTLSRAIGLPSREVAGLIYTGDKTKTFAAHSWNEVFLDGRWISVDPTFNRFHVNPAYIPFGTGEKGIVNLTRALGQLSFKVVDISYGS